MMFGVLLQVMYFFDVFEGVLYECDFDVCYFVQVYWLFYIVWLFVVGQVQQYGQYYVGCYFFVCLGMLRKLGLFDGCVYGLFGGQCLCYVWVFYLYGVF